MQLTVFEILNLQRSLPVLASKPIPAKTSFRISKLLPAIETEVTTAEKARTALVEKYGAIDPKNANQKTVLPENMETFNKEFTALLQTKIEISFEKISLDDLGNIEIAPADLRNLHPLFI